MVVYLRSVHIESLSSDENDNASEILNILKSQLHSIAGEIIMPWGH